MVIQECSIGNCRRVARRKGFCITHYRWQKQGRDMSRPIQQQQGRGLPASASKMCAREGCVNVASARNLCHNHYVLQRDREFKCELVRLHGSVCLDCQQVFPDPVFQFHHRDPEGKDFTLARVGHGHSWEEAVAEAEKCDMLCANCHLIRHYVKKG